MATSVKTSGSQTATLTTEHTLATITDAGVYVLSLDASNLVGVEELVLKIYGKARSSDSEALIFTASFTGPQIEKLKQSPALLSPHHWRATLTQYGGTGRAFPWAVYQA